MADCPNLLSAFASPDGPEPCDLPAGHDGMHGTNAYGPRINWATDGTFRAGVAA